MLALDCMAPHRASIAQSYPQRSMTMLDVQISQVMKVFRVKKSEPCNDEGIQCTA